MVIANTVSIWNNYGQIGYARNVLYKYLKLIINNKIIV